MLKQQTNSRNYPILFDLPFLWLIKKCNWFENFNHFFKISPLLYMESNLRNGMASYSQTQEYSSWGTHWLTPLQEIIYLFTCASKCTIDPSRGIDFIHLPKHCLRDQRSPSPSLGWHPHFLEAFLITSKLCLPRGEKSFRLHLTWPLTPTQRPFQCCSQLYNLVMCEHEVLFGTMVTPAGCHLLCVCRDLVFIS